MIVTRTVTGTIEPHYELRLVTGVDTSVLFDIGVWFREQVEQHTAIIARKRGLIDPRSRMGRMRRRRYNALYS